MNANQPAIEQLDLRDIHEPAAPSTWPPASGWWLLAVLVVATLITGVWGAWRHWHHARRRQRILSELDGLGRNVGGPALVAGVSALLKRAALSRFPQLDVAALTGSDWLAFLDRTGGGGAFQNGAGRVLADGPYAPAPRCDTDALLALARTWLRKNT